MVTKSAENQRQKIERLEARLAEAEELIEAIKAGEVDAFALNNGHQAEVFTLQSGDYAYRVLIEKFNEGALNLTEEGLVVYTNEYFSQLVQVPYNSVLGTDITNFVHPDSIEIFQSVFKKALGGNSRAEINLLVEGRSIPVYVSLTSLQPVMATIGMIVTDLTEKKQNEKLMLQQEEDLKILSRSDKLKTDFIKIASHELNTPVTSIKGYTQILLAILKQAEAEGTYSREIVANSLLKIDKQVSRLVRLISELLDISRIEGGQFKLRTEVFKITELINEVVEDVALVNGTYHIDLSLNIAPEVNADKDRLSQVFSNLILNAIKYSSPEHPIEISLDQYGEGQIAIKVIDRGIGINPEDLSKIFERFYRSGKHNADTYPGFGLGLFISKEIVKSHGGEIKVESEKGKGSTFTVILPVYKG